MWRVRESVSRGRKAGTVSSCIVYRERERNEVNIKLHWVFIRTSQWLGGISSVAIIVPELRNVRV